MGFVRNIHQLDYVKNKQNTYVLNIIHVIGIHLA